MLVMASVAIFVPISVDSFSTIAVFDICLASINTVNSDSGTAAKQTNDSLYE